MSRSSVAVTESVAPLLFATGLPTFGGETTLDGTPAGTGGTTRPLRFQSGPQSAAETLEGQTTVPELRAFIVGHHPDLGSDAFDQPVPLSLAEHRGIHHREPDLGATVGTIGVLTAGTSTRTEGPVQFGRRNEQRRAEAQAIFLAHPGSIGSDVRRTYDRPMTDHPSPPSGTEWVTRFAQELGLEPLEPAVIDALLDLAGVAAHTSERWAAPLTCYLVGRAGVDPLTALERARQLAAERPD